MVDSPFLSYNERTNIITLLDKIKNNATDLEFEIRLGHFQENMFKSEINQDFYNKIYNNNSLYSSQEITEENSLVCKSNLNSQKIIEYENNKVTKIYYRKKDRVSMINLNLLETRVSLAKETELTNSTELFNDCFRFKKRISKISKDGLWRFDFTKVFDLELKSDTVKDMNLLLENSKFHYEVEIEYIKDIKTLTYNIIIEKLLMIRDNEYNNHKHVLRNIQNLFSNEIPENRVFKRSPPHMLQFKKITNPVITLTSKNINNILKDHCVTEKTDGENNFIYIDNKNVFLINDRSEIKKLSLTLTNPKLANSLINGEYIDYLNTFYAFDILIYSKKDLTNTPFTQRYKYLQELNTSFTESSDMKIKSKKFYMKDVIKSADTIYNNTKFDYKIDGLVFTPLNTGFRDTIYKWKPLHQLTVDFLVKQSPYNKDEFFLYNTINKKDLQKYNINTDDDHEKLFPMYPRDGFYVPIKFQMPNINKKLYIVKNNKLKDNTVVEFFYEDNTWKIERLRVDKTENYQKSMRMKRFWGPNAYGVAFDNWEALHNNPITLDIITGKEPIPKVKISRYFTGKDRKQSGVFGMNLFHSLVIKDMLYKMYVGIPRKNHNVLELAGGRGGDIRKYDLNHVRHVVFQDIDNVALDEAKRRLSTMNHRFKARFFQGDLGTDIRDKLGKHPFDSVSMQFAIHYMLKNKTTLENMFNNVNDKLKKNGYFIFTAMDGQLVFNTLTQKSIQYKESYELKKDNEKILGITRLYKENTFEELGQEVSVFVSSIGDHAGEYLVNFDYVLGYFVKRGYQLVASEYFKNILDKNEQANDFAIKKMGDAEKEFSSLYRYMVLEKTNFL